MNNKEKILGYDICIINQDNLIEKIYNDFQKNEQNFIVNINPEIIMTNYKNENLKNIFNSQKYQIPDGSGIVWASKKKKGQIKERITGIDLMQKICEKASLYDAKIFLFGAKPEIAQKAKIELQKKYKNINIVGVCSGYVSNAIAINEINNSNADILFVGLGSPKQEQFIIENKEQLKNVKIFMPVGGSFDVISKSKKRAPNWMIKINLEWLYRLFQEPKRIFRQLSLFKFIILVKKEKRNAKN